MPGNVCPECGFIHPPLPPGHKCPIKKAKKDFSIYSYIQPTINKLDRLTEKLPNKKEEIGERTKVLLINVVKILEEEFNVKVD